VGNHGRFFFEFNPPLFHKKIRRLHYIIQKGGGMGLLKCCVCSKDFERLNGEISRNKKIGRKVFCSRSCSGKCNVTNIPHEKKSAKHLKKGSDRDEYSPFRFFHNICRRRAKAKPSLKLDLTLEDLKKQWEKQRGICPYTGWQMKIAECQSPSKSIEKSPDRASLDRIDSSKGYVKDNVQFVALIVQYAKNDWNGKVIFDFANAVSNYIGQPEPLTPRPDID
jgi:hypothetical protein